MGNHSDHYIEDNTGQTIFPASGFLPNASIPREATCPKK